MRAAIIVLLLALPAVAAAPQAPPEPHAWVPLGAALPVTPGLHAPHALQPDFLPVSYADLTLIALASASQGYAATATERLTHRLYPLGDADGDGRTDILVTTDAQRRLLSAGRLDYVVWTTSEPVVPTGDLDGDGVSELVTFTDRLESTDGPRTMGYEGSIRFEVFSGRDLAPMLSVEAPAYSRTTIDAELAPGVENPRPDLLTVGSRHDTTEQAWPLLVVHDGHAWLLTFLMRYESDSSNYVAAAEMKASIEVGNTLARLDEEGKPVWMAGDLGVLTASLARDADADRIPDALFGSGARVELSFEGDLVRGYTFGTDEPVPGRVLLVSGADGTPLLDAALPDLPGFHPTWYGDLWGDGAVIGSSTFQLSTSPTAGITFESRFALLAADGSVRVSDSWNGLVVVAPNGDVDRDGMDDLLRMDLMDGAAAALSADLAVLWEVDDDVHGALDGDGDGVWDILVSPEATATDKQREYQAFHGRDLAQMYTTVVEGRLGGSADVDMDGGDDLYAVIVRGEGNETGLESIDLRLVSGDSGRDIWQKRVFDAADYAEPVWADLAFAWLHPIGRVDRDRAADLQVQLQHFESMTLECDGDGCRFVDDAPDMPVLDADAILSAASGDAILRFDDMPLAEGGAAAPDHAAEVGPAGRTLQSRANDASAPGLVALLGLLAGAILVRRR